MPRTVRKKAAIAIEGGLRIGAAAVEANGIPLYRRGSKLKGDRIVELEAPTIAVTYVLKGGRNASYSATLTINGKSKKEEGNIANGILVLEKQYAFADFGL